MISDLNIGLVADLNDLDDGVVVLALDVVVVSRKRIVDHELDVVVVAAPIDDNDPVAGFGVGAPEVRVACAHPDLSPFVALVCHPKNKISKFKTILRENFRLGS